MLSDSQENKFPIIIENSPIDFIIIGPYVKDKVKILVKGDKTSLQLLGEYINGRKRGYQPVKWLGIDVSYNIRFVDCKYSDLEKESNESEQDFPNLYTFVWSGLCTSKSDLNKIKDIFSVHLSYIVTGIKNNDVPEVEWQLSSLLAFCSAINRKHIFKKLIKKILFV